MGANDNEADGALTKKDFLHCYSVVRKEGKETLFWLKVIKNMNNLSVVIDEVLIEGEEIVAIVSTIIKNASLSTNERRSWGTNDEKF